MPAALQTADGGAVSRRVVLAAALGSAGLAVGGGVAAWSRWVGSAPDTGGTRLVSGSFTSAAMGRVRTGWTVAYPPGHNVPGLPVLVALHGRTGHHGDAFSSLHLHHPLAQAVRHGVAPFAIASVDGGDHNYWHPRRDTDAAAMVIDEFLPLLARRGLAVSRVGLIGWSMGGYGALYLAGALRQRAAVAVAESPAIWHEAGQSAAGAFDDAADFEAHSILGHLGRLRGIPLRIDCGDRDGFAPVTRDLRAALSPTPAGGIEPGGHDSSFWRSQAPAQLAFVGAHLAGH